MKATTYKVLAAVDRYSDAATKVPAPGDCAIVERAGVRRQLVMRCPDGCGDILSINLDARSGKAWRIYQRKGVWSLFPSIDRPTGCLSHFILWRGRISWIDVFDGQEENLDTIAESLEARVMETLRSKETASFTELADTLDEIPWDVLAACRSLKRRKLLEEGTGRWRGVFWVSKFTDAI
jgi:hypothetical protein